jgi:ribosomal subunit interface protein
MDVTITGRNVGIPDRFEEYVTEKTDKVEHLAPRALALEIKLCRHHETNGSSGDDRVELTLIGPGPIVRAESAASDKYAAFDLALAKFVETKLPAAGRLVWTSGQIPVAADGTQAPAGDWEAQARLTFENVGHALAAGGATWADVVKLTIFVVDLAGLPVIRVVRDEVVDVERPPTSSLVQVAGLVLPDVLLEVEAVACVPA